MKLRDLLAPLFSFYILGEAEVMETEISSIETDSRRIKPGSLFVCLVGSKTDGHQFIVEAKQNGAAAILAQKHVDVALPVIVVSDTRRALAVLACHFYDYPTNKLKLIGVTGTNGKTTTTYFIEKILEDNGQKTGRIGTINMRIEREIKELNNTTPESLALQKAFHKMVNVGSNYAIIEASSHAIHMGRTRGCNFRTLVFTNLTQDHLDYHGSMEEYKQAKGLAFAQLGNKYDQRDLKYAILNSDDQASHYFAQITPAQVITYGINNWADIQATDIRTTPQGTSFKVHTHLDSEEFHVQTLGNFNVYNMLAAVAVGLIEGLSLAQMKKSLEEIKGVKGRLEMISTGQDFTVIVDYAHTPDSLKNVLETIKEFAQGKIYCIVGCGGDRDRRKRPIMAKIAADLADVAVFTSDNPRTEDPMEIIKDMLSGLKHHENSQTTYKEIIDRRQAIEWTINQAKKNDIVLIAGKGHETYQIINNHVFPFDDGEEARKAIVKRLNK